MSDIYLPLERGAALMREVTSHNERKSLFFSFFVFKDFGEDEFGPFESLAIPKPVQAPGSSVL